MSKERHTKNKMYSEFPLNGNNGFDHCMENHTIHVLTTLLQENSKTVKKYFSQDKYSFVLVY